MPWSERWERMTTKRMAGTSSFVGQHQNGPGSPDQLGDGSEDAGGLAESHCARRPPTGTGPALDSRSRPRTGYGGMDGGLGDAPEPRPKGRQDGGPGGGDESQGPRGGQPERAGAIGGVENASGERLQGRSDGVPGVPGDRRSGGAGPWGDYDLIPCSDGKSRRVESGTFPLAHGVSGRVGRLRAYGNAIVPQVAAEFVRAYLETC